MYKKLILRILIVGCLILAVPLARAQFTFTTNNGQITVTGYTGPGGAVSIPTNINGLPVTSIGAYAFDSHTSLASITSITLPDGITSIGESAFGQTSLTDVTIPNSVTIISDAAFYSCYNLTNVTIGKGVTNIGQEAFSFDNLVSVTVPDSVTMIGAYAFSGCQSLTAVTIGNGVTLIGGYAFPDCQSLTAVRIGNSVTSIGPYAFSGCDYLPSITIPSSVTIILDGALGSCSRLNTVYFMGNAPYATIFAFLGGNPATTAYYLPGTTGWTTNLSGLPTAPWALPYPLILDGNNGSTNFRVQGNQFGFTVSWATNNRSVIVEGATNLSNPVWQPLQTFRPTTGSFYFSDPQWANYPGRFYRVHSPAH